jgi:hypothetical protein
MQYSNGIDMGLDNNSISTQTGSDVVRQYEDFQRLNLVRRDLDHSLTALPDDDEGRDALWQELESVLAQISGLVRQLAATFSPQPADLRAKASVLATLLRIGEINPPALAPETVALAISLADEVSRLDR